MTKTTSFIKQMLNIPHIELINNGFKDAYLGHYQETGELWGEFIYLSLEIEKMRSDFRSKLISHSNFISIELIDGNLLFKFSISENNKELVIKPFLNGKYSLIDKKYVNTYFTQYSNDGTTISKSNNWKVLHKDPELARYWEKRIGVAFTEDMEVWSRPEKEDEIYGYKTSNTDFTEEVSKSASSGE